MKYGHSKMEVYNFPVMKKPLAKMVGEPSKPNA